MKIATIVMSLVFAGVVAQASDAAHTGHAAPAAATATTAGAPAAVAPTEAAAPAKIKKEKKGHAKTEEKKEGTSK